MENVTTTDKLDKLSMFLAKDGRMKKYSRFYEYVANKDDGSFTILDAIIELLNATTDVDPKDDPIQAKAEAILFMTVVATEAWRAPTKEERIATILKTAEQQGALIELVKQADAHEHRGDELAVQILHQYIRLLTELRNNDMVESETCVCLLTTLIDQHSMVIPANGKPSLKDIVELAKAGMRKLGADLLTKVVDNI